MINDRRGPRPAAAPGRPLSASRAEILDTLVAQDAPASLAALCSRSGLHANTVREHLDALLAQGLVSRERSTPSGRGRPAWLYRATARAAAGRETVGAEYAGLAAALAGVVARTSDDPVAEARAAGAEWGDRLAQEQGAPTEPGPEPARRQVGRLFERMGFAPELDEAARTMRLTRCPLLEAAHQHPEVVCAVHLGITEGAMARYGEDGSGSELVPFAEPGACLLHVREAEA